VVAEEDAEVGRVDHSSAGTTNRAPAKKKKSRLEQVMVCPYHRIRPSKILPPGQIQLMTKKENSGAHNKNVRSPKKLKINQDQCDVYQQHANALQGELMTLCSIYNETIIGNEEYADGKEASHQFYKSKCDA